MYSQRGRVVTILVAPLAVLGVAAQLTTTTQWVTVPNTMTHWKTGCPPFPMCDRVTWDIDPNFGQSSTILTSTSTISTATESATSTRIPGEPEGESFLLSQEIIEDDTVEQLIFQFEFDGKVVLAPASTSSETRRIPFFQLTTNGYMKEADDSPEYVYLQPETTSRKRQITNSTCRIQYRSLPDVPADGITDQFYFRNGRYVRVDYEGRTYVNYREPRIDKENVWDLWTAILDETVPDSWELVQLVRIQEVPSAPTNVNTATRSDDGGAGGGTAGSTDISPTPTGGTESAYEVILEFGLQPYCSALLGYDSIRTSLKTDYETGESTISTAYSTAYSTETVGTATVTATDLVVETLPGSITPSPSTVPPVRRRAHEVQLVTVDNTVYIPVLVPEATPMPKAASLEGRQVPATPSQLSRFSPSEVSEGCSSAVTSPVPAFTTTTQTTFRGIIHTGLVTTTSEVVRTATVRETSYTTVFDPAPTFTEYAGIGNMCLYDPSSVNNQYGNPNENFNGGPDTGYNVPELFFTQPNPPESVYRNFVFIHPESEGAGYRVQYQTTPGQLDADPYWLVIGNNDPTLFPTGRLEWKKAVDFEAGYEPVRFTLTLDRGNYFIGATAEMNQGRNRAAKCPTSQGGASNNRWIVMASPTADVDSFACEWLDNRGGTSLEFAKLVRPTGT